MPYGLSQKKCTCVIRVKVEDGRDSDQDGLTILTNTALSHLVPGQTCWHVNGCTKYLVQAAVTTVAQAAKLWIQTVLHQ